MNEPVRRLAPASPPTSPEPRSKAFAEALAAARGKHVLIALRGHPDPDGIACAIAQAHIAQRLGVAQTTIGYCHELSHRENRALVKLLGLELRKIKSVREVGRVDFLGLVDSHEVDPDLTDAGEYEVLTIVDHHRTTAPPRARFVDLRVEVGATATIFVEYLQDLAPLDPDVEEDRRIATALMHGLATDTDDFMLARAADFRAAAQIAEVCDRDLLQDLSRRLIAPTAMDVIARALQALVVRRNFAMAGVGFVSEAERDTIAQAADFLVRREDIDTCVVYGVVGDKYIEGSLRTHSPSVDPAVWLEQAFGTDDKGRPFGGGRRDKGAFRIPIGFLGRVTDRQQLWQLVEHAVRTALLRQSGEEPTPGVIVPPVAPRIAADAAAVRIAFFGLPLAALLLAGDGHDVVWAGVCRRGAIGTRRLKRRLGERVELVPDLSKGAVFERVRDARPDLLVSWFWTTKIPARMLALAPAVGVHPSLLPRHRGPDPCFWAIDAGDEMTGVTAHLLEQEYDTGAVLGQRALRIDPSWDGWRLARALDRPSLGLLRDVVRAWAEGRPPAAVTQDERLATAALEPDDDELAIRWAWPAERIERRVRAAAPWPGAWTEIGDRLVTLVRVRTTRDFPRALAPAEGAVRADGIAVVRAGDGAVELLAGRGEDDEPLDENALAALVHAAR